MNADKKRGRPSLTPTFLSVVSSTPEGQPVILQALATTPALAYHHRRNLAASGINAEVVPPGKEKLVGKGLVKNPTNCFALVAAGTGPRRVKGKFVKIEREIVASI
jgi:hypothetical protein